MGLEWPSYKLMPYVMRLSEAVTGYQEKVLRLFLYVVFQLLLFPGVKCEFYQNSTPCSINFIKRLLFTIFLQMNFP